MKHLVIGSEGEIGQALYSILKVGSRKIYKHDLSWKHPSDIKCDVLHICIRWSDDFPYHVLNYAEKFGVRDAFIVIHSTVLPFTTKNLSKVIKNVVYSPTRGNHPNLYSDMLKYTKYFAAEDPEAVGLIEKMFQLLGLKTQIVKDASSLEFAKHYSTEAFGISLAMTQEVYAAKKTYGIDPEIIMDFVNDTGSYTGDRKIYPYIEKIGGHCVIENAKMFQPYSPLAVHLIKTDKKFGNIYPEKNYRLKEDK